MKYIKFSFHYQSQRKLLFSETQSIFQSIELELKEFLIFIITAVFD